MYVYCDTERVCGCDVSVVSGTALAFHVPTTTKLINQMPRRLLGIQQEAPQARSPVWTVPNTVAVTNKLHQRLKHALVPISI